MSILPQTDDAANSRICPDPLNNESCSNFDSEYLCSTTQDSAYFSQWSGADTTSRIEYKRNTTHAGNRSNICRKDRFREVQNRTTERRTMGYRAFNYNRETGYNS
jgi:hypothetical protein